MYYINNNKINISEKDYLDQGCEGRTYRIDNNIYKIYHDNLLNFNSKKLEEAQKYLKKIKTKQIILPEDIIYDKDDNYVGYKTKYINGKVFANGFTKIDSKSFINNLKKIKDDLNILSDNYVLAYDFNLRNCIFDNYNNILNIIDTGSYMNHILENENEYKKNNYRQFNSLIYLLLRVNLNNYIHKLSLINQEIISSNSTYYDYLKDKLDNYDNVEEYIKYKS